METAAGGAGQRDVARDGDLFGFGRGAAQAEDAGDPAIVHDTAVHEVRVLGVVHDRAAGHAAVRQGVPHQAGALDHVAVVGKGDRAGVRHVGHLRQFLALLAPGDCADRVDADDAAPASGRAHPFDV